MPAYPDTMLYQLLSVDPRASKAEIQNSFGRIWRYARKNMGDWKIQSTYRVCALAFQILSDEGLRSRYDNDGVESVVLDDAVTQHMITGARWYFPLTFAQTNDQHAEAAWDAQVAAVQAAQAAAVQAAVDAQTTAPQTAAPQANVASESSSQGTPDSTATNAASSVRSRLVTPASGATTEATSTAEPEPPVTLAELVASSEPDFDKTHPVSQPEVAMWWHCWAIYMTTPFCHPLNVAVNAANTVLDDRIPGSGLDVSYNVGRQNYADTAPATEAAAAESQNGTDTAAPATEAATALTYRDAQIWGCRVLQPLPPPVPMPASGPMPAPGAMPWSGPMSAPVPVPAAGPDYGMFILPLHGYEI